MCSADGDFLLSRTTVRWWLFSPKTILETPRINRWYSTIQDCDFSIPYRKNEEMHSANALSRIYAKNGCFLSELASSQRATGTEQEPLNILTSEQHPEGSRVIIKQRIRNSSTGDSKLSFMSSETWLPGLECGGMSKKFWTNVRFVMKTIANTVAEHGLSRPSFV